VSCRAKAKHPRISLKANAETLRYAQGDRLSTFSIYSDFFRYTTLALGRLSHRGKINKLLRSPFGERSMRSLDWLGKGEGTPHRSGRACPPGNARTLWDGDGQLHVTLCGHSRMENASNNRTIAGRACPMRWQLASRRPRLSTSLEDSFDIMMDAWNQAPNPIEPARRKQSAMRASIFG
jgi:hypothetical protein